MRLGTLAALLATLAVNLGSAGAEQRATLQIRVRQLRNTSGLVRVALFRSADGYPEDNTKAARTLSVSASGGVSELRLPNVAAGTWGLALLHDENSNGKLDRNFIGIPLEGVGASNGAASRLGPPKFEDARFVVGSADVQLSIDLVYWL